MFKYFESFNFICDDIILLCYYFILTSIFSVIQHELKPYSNSFIKLCMNEPIESYTTLWEILVENCIWFFQYLLIPKHIHFIKGNFN